MGKQQAHDELETEDEAPDKQVEEISDREKLEAMGDLEDQPKAEVVDEANKEQILDSDLPEAVRSVSPPLSTQLGEVDETI